MVAIGAALCLFGVLQQNDLSQNIVSRVLMWIGDRSYSIYLIHMPILYAGIYSPLFDNTRVIATVIAFILSIILGNVIYENIEERFRIKSKELDSPRASIPTLLISFVLIPILIFTLIREGANNNYWGRDPNPIPPTYAVVDDPSCYLDISPCSYLAKNPIGEALLIGDSHAAALFQTFATTLNSIGVSTFGMQKAGCQFILQENVSKEVAKALKYGVLSAGYKETCFSHNKSIVQWIKSNPNTIVFISQRSSSIRPKSIDEENFQRIVLENLIYLKNISADLVVVGPNPEFPDPSRVFQGGLLIWDKPYIPPKSFPIAAMIGEPFRDNRHLTSNIFLHGIHFVDTIGPFCDETRCTRYQNSTWLFGDSEHLTHFGVSRLKQQILEQMKKVLGVNYLD